MAFTVIHVVGRWLRQDGTTPESGQVTFTLSTPISDGTNKQVAPLSVVAPLDSTGAIAVDLVANDDVTTKPVGTSYRVLIEVAGGPPVSKTVTLVHTVSPVDLATLY